MSSEGSEVGVSEGKGGKKLKDNDFRKVWKFLPLKNSYHAKIMVTVICSLSRFDSPVLGRVSLALNAGSCSDSDDSNALGTGLTKKVKSTEVHV